MAEKKVLTFEKVLAKDSASGKPMISIKLESGEWLTCMKTDRQGKTSKAYTNIIDGGEGTYEVDTDGTFVRSAKLVSVDGVPTPAPQLTAALNKVEAAFAKREVDLSYDHRASDCLQGGIELAVAFTKIQQGEGIKLQGEYNYQTKAFADLAIYFAKELFAGTVKGLTSLPLTAKIEQVAKEEALPY